jgi:hypothetical protein
MSKTKFAIGCFVQWYEIDIIQEYVDSLADAIRAYDGPIDVDMTLSMGQWLEKTTLTEEEMNVLELRVYDMFHELQRIRDGVLVHIRRDVSKYSIADYRRDFNNMFCVHADVLVWGESDMLVPKQMFTVLDMLHQQQKDVTPKYLATFGICKMWDESWKTLEHTEFTDKPFIPNDYDNWWSLKYTMNREEMNRFNDDINDIDLRIINPHKFNGCGLVISSEVIKSGVNIPKSVFFVHEDTAFMMMIQKLLGNIPQYHFKNILVVHNRNHPNKRNYIYGETGDTLNQKRRSNDWYVKANKFSEENCYNMFNPNYKSKTWNDVWQA